MEIFYIAIYSCYFCTLLATPVTFFRHIVGGYILISTQNGNLLYKYHTTPLENCHLQEVCTYNTVFLFTLSFIRLIFINGKGSMYPSLNHLPKYLLFSSCFKDNHFRILSMCKVIEVYIRAARCNFKYLYKICKLTKFSALRKNFN